MPRRDRKQFVRLLLAVFLATLSTGRDARAEIQPTFDMNYCCENSKLIVVGTLDGDRLTVNQVLSSVRMGMATIQLQGNPVAERLRSAMGKRPGAEIEVVAFLNEKNQPLLGIAGLVGLAKDDVYLVYIGADLIGLRGQLEPARFPNLNRAKFLDATRTAIALIKKRRQIAKRPRSAERAEALLDFLNEQAEEAAEVQMPNMWPNHHTRYVATAMSPIHADEEQVVLRSLRETKDFQRRVRLLKLIAGIPCTEQAFEPAAKWIAPEHDSEVRAAAVTAIGRIDNYRAVDRLIPLLDFDDPDLSTLLRGLYTRSDSSQYWPRNPKAIASLESLTKEALARQQRGKGISSNLGYTLLGANHAFFHPRLLPLLIDWSTSDHPTASQAQSYLRDVTGLDFDRKKLDPTTDWWAAARVKFQRQYDLSSTSGVDAWLVSYESADASSKKILNRLWLFEQSVRENHLLKRATSETDPRSSTAKTTLSELWKNGQLSGDCKRSIIGAFMDVKLVELDQPGIKRGVRELQIVVTSRFHFPKNAWVQNKSAFGINRNPSRLGNSWGSRGLDSETDVVFGSMGGGRYEGQPTAKAILVLREYDYQRGNVVWSQEWELGPIKLKDSKKTQ